LFLPEEGAQETVERLHGTYKLGIVSNGVGEAQHKRLLAGGLRQRFDALIVSDEADVAKPHPDIFASALRQLNVARQDVLFIGDSLRDDYEGARAAGIDFCLYNRRGLPLPPDVQPMYEVRHLKQLAKLLPV
jgi:HAD superfamily hydrolase (TIGR01549 family)